MISFDRQKVLQNLCLQLLKHEVHDDRFMVLLEDMGRLIRRSEEACSQADKQHDEFVIDAECDYLEELIGMSFLLLQAKVRRVKTAARKMHKAMQNGPSRLESLSTDEKVLSLGRKLGSHRRSLVQFIWHIANYYKHRDEWSGSVWNDDLPEDSAMKTARKTRCVVEELGIVMSSTGNLRRAYESLGVVPYSACGKLAADTQRWAEQVLECAESAMR